MHVRVTQIPIIFPWAPPMGFPSGSGNISLYTSPLVTIQLQYICRFSTICARALPFAASTFTCNWNMSHNSNIKFCQSHLRFPGSTRKMIRKIFEILWIILENKISVVFLGKIGSILPMFDKVATTFRHGLNGHQVLLCETILMKRGIFFW